MCIKFIRQIFGIPDPGVAAQAAKDAAETAANSDEAGRQAEDDRLRKLLGKRGAGTFLNPLGGAGDPPVSVKTLLGQ